MAKNKERIILALILIIATILRFYNLMHDQSYFFDPDERNMAIAVTQFRLPEKPSSIPICLISQIRQIATENCNFNPRFFAYGQFPLYLAFLSDQFSKLILYFSPNSQLQITNYLFSSFPSAIFWLRFWSALASTLTVLFVYLIAKELIDKHTNKFSIFNFQFSIVAALMAAFSPGLIQSAHFGTTESFLTLFFMASIYLSMKLTDSATVKSFPKYLILNTRYLILLSLTVGLALGSKLTGIFLLIPPAIALLVNLCMEIKQKKIRRKKKNLVNVLLSYGSIALLIVIGSGIFFVISSPYNLIDFEGFKGSVFGYEADVATGKYEAFYTRQFVDTVPILFQMEKIFPFALGWPVFILGTLGFLLINLNLMIYVILLILSKMKRSKFKMQKYNSKFKIFNFKLQFLIFNFAFLIYFLPNAFLFAKWTRFMTPVFPFFAIFAGLGVQQIYQVLKNFIIKYQKSNNIFSFSFFILHFAFLILVILPGIAFMSIYTHEDSRVTASRWIYENVPSNSYILSETANVVDIPLQIPNYTLPSRDYNLTVISFDFYHLDEEPRLFLQLLNHLEKADYILIPSRRIFANHPRQANKYPLVTKYYQLLFSGRLGFEKVTEISSFPGFTLYPLRLTLPDEEAEETFTVFDHPVVRIYRKTKSLNIEEYKKLFKNQEQSLL